MLYVCMYVNTCIYLIVAETRSCVMTVHDGSSSHIFLVFFVVCVKVDAAAGSADRPDGPCSVRTRPVRSTFDTPLYIVPTFIDARHVYRSDYCRFGALD